MLNMEEIHQRLIGQDEVVKAGPRRSARASV